jgi:hypothetical protein
MGAVHACQKTGKCASEKIEKIAKSIKPKDAEDFAKAKHKGLPDKVEDKKDKKYPTFREWMQLKETGTSTSCIAAFKAPIGGEVEEPKKKKHKKDK